MYPADLIESYIYWPTEADLKPHHLHLLTKEKNLGKSPQGVYLHFLIWLP